MTDSCDKQYLFEAMPPGRALAAMAMPTIASQLVNLVYNVVDTIFIGQTGDAYKTAAVTLAFTLFMMTVSFASLFGIGGGSLIARLLGAGRRGMAKSVSALAFHGAVASALLYSAAVALTMEPLLRFLGASENTLGFCKQYVWGVVVLGNLPVILSMAVAHLLRSTGYSRQAGLGLMIGSLLNVALDPLFMFVLLPPGLEVLGASLATLVSNVAACAYLVRTMARVAPEAALSMDPRRIRRVGRAELRSFFGVGIPSALLTGLFDLANICLNALTAAHGDLQLAAMGIVMRAERLPNAINIGICQGMLPLVAYNYASGDHPRMRAVMRTARRAGLAVSLGSMALFLSISSRVCGLFLDTGAAYDPSAAVATLAFAATFLRVRCLASPLQFLNYSTSFAMQAVGYGAGTLLHACFRELAFYIPFMFLLDRLFGLPGLMSAIIAGEGAGALYALALFHRWKRRHLRP